MLATGRGGKSFGKTGDGSVHGFSMVARWCGIRTTVDSGDRVVKLIDGRSDT